MKVSKIPGLGRFGVYIDDVDFNTITDEEWLEIGKIHLESLVTILRNVNLSIDEYNRRMRQWGDHRDLAEYRLTKKYGMFMSQMIPKIKSGELVVDPSDAHEMIQAERLSVLNKADLPTALRRITGKRNQDGEPLGLFAEGELLWHSNESGNLSFAPGVSLLGSEGMVGSSTGFMTTTDWYESQSESFRSELNEMVVLHKFIPGKINPGLRESQDSLMYKNMCPADDTEIPLVIRSPGGHTGLHYSVNTISRIKGMSQEESDKLLARITSELFTEEYTYDHWYTQDNDLCLFDNSIVQHRRLGGVTNRLAYRYQYDFSFANEPYMPYFQEPFITAYKEQITDVVNTMGLKRFKLPT